ncbi:MAG TPA: tetratricopeptide repeat protein, partial [Kofleriaceae bacterium]|nr:tetratricopeptide repeat protein [Kofleriaceae bacterium]
LARARRGDATRDELAALALDRAQPAIVRATVFELMPPDACAAIAPRAIADPSPLVRSTAVACAEPHVARAGLRDSVRLVRIEAARVLAGLRIDEPDRAAYAVARGELEDAYRLDLDRPEGWFNLATLAESESRTTDAIAAYRRALALDPDYAPARDNLRRLER